DAEVVALGDVAVADSLAGHDPGRIAVIHPRSDVERLAVGDDADFSALRDGRAFVQLALDEPGDRRGVAPRRVVEAAVDHWGTGDDARRGVRWILAGQQTR